MPISDCMGYLFLHPTRMVRSDIVYNPGPIGTNGPSTSFPTVKTPHTKGGDFLNPDWWILLERVLNKFFCFSAQLEIYGRLSEFK